MSTEEDYGMGSEWTKEVDRLVKQVLGPAALPETDKTAPDETEAESDNDDSAETPVWILTADGKVYAGALSEEGDAVFTTERLTDRSTYWPDEAGHEPYFATDLIDVITTLKRVTFQTDEPTSATKPGN